MSYLVLARKWRPQKFEDIVGQSFVRKTLQNAILSGRVAHAFLFTGARGVGKTSTARILAKSLNCFNGPTVEPCNECENCNEIANGNNVDVLEIDGASNRGIDEVRELRENIKYFPSRSKHKIYIIDEVHMLTKEAFNALLKTLEEPPPHAIFIFATTEPHKIPITILSRCQRFDFKKISLKDISGHLEFILKAEGVKISDASILQIAKAANGSMRDSQSVLDQIISYCGNEISDEDVNDILGIIDRALIFALVKAVIEKDAGKALKIINSVYNYGYDINSFCFSILETFRDIVAFKVADDPKELIELSDGELIEIKALADEIDVNELLLIFNILYKAEEDITKSLTPKMLLEMSILRMINRFRVLPLAAIMNKITELEKKVLNKADNVINIKGYSPVPPESSDVRAVASTKVVSTKADSHDIKDPVKGFLHFLNEENIILYSHIESLKKVEIQESEVVLSADNNYFLEYFESEEVKMELKGLLERYFKKNFTITIKTVDKVSKNSLYNKRGVPKVVPVPAGTVAGTIKPDAHINKGRISEVEKSDPIFTMAKELFEGEIIDIKLTNQ